MIFEIRLADRKVDKTFEGHDTASVAVGEEQGVVLHIRRISRDTMKSMAHQFNKTAFDLGHQAGNPLLSLYCALVSIELSLKDNAPQWQPGHKIETWLTNISDPGLTSLAYQLSSGLQRIYCTDLRGKESSVALDSYPDLRYIRHDSDYAGKTPTTDLESALVLAKDIKQNLVKRGVR